MRGRRYLSIVVSLLLILSLGLSVLAEAPESTPPPAGEESPAEVPAPEETPVPVETEAPAETAPPAETSAPVWTPPPDPVPETPPAPAETPVSAAGNGSTAPDEDLPSREVPADDPRFLDRTWDEIMAEFLRRKYAAAENVGVVYYNTVTCETHMINGDEYFYAASLYKLPLNMYFGEKIYNGEMSMDDKIYNLRYGDMQRSSLQFSANWTSETLQSYLGGMSAFVDAIRPYILDEGEEGDRNQLMNNYFTPRQMLRALKLLYEAPERYPDIEYYLKLAMPDGFFRQNERRFPIAHKYGWFNEQGYGVANDIGIVWTDEPILLVFMSNYIPGSTITIGEYCALMCDYSQYWHGRRIEETRAAVLRAAQYTKADADALARAVSALPTRASLEAAAS